MEFRTYVGLEREGEEKEWTMEDHIPMLQFKRQ